MSGGPDSLALLLLAHAAFPGKVAAATVDHGLRAESADEVAQVARICAVIGVPHERWGETAKAMVVKKEGAEVTEQDIIDYARERLAKFKCPTSVDWLDALPRNPSGKILKKDLRAPYWEGRTRNVN